MSGQEWVFTASANQNLSPCLPGLRAAWTEQRLGLIGPLFPWWCCSGDREVICGWRQLDCHSSALHTGISWSKMKSSADKGSLGDYGWHPLGAGWM